MPIRCKFKKKRSLISYTFLMILYMYIAPGQRQTTPWGQTFDVNGQPLSLAHCRFKNYFEDRFYIHFFHISPYVYSPCRQSVGDKILITIERPFLVAHTLQVSYVYIYIAPGQGQKTPWGQNFDVNRKPLSLRPFVASFKQISLISDFIHILMFFHIYIAWGRGRQPSVDKILMSTEKPCHFAHLLQVSKNISLKSEFIHNSSGFLYMYMAPGQGQTSPWDQNFLYEHKPFVTPVICCKFLQLNYFLTVFPI